MPKLLVFAPCERAIISGGEGGDNSSSLIAILESLTVEGPVPKDAGTPIRWVRWVIFSLWQRTAEDETKEYEQVCRFIEPSGKVIIDSVLSFRFTKQNQRNTVQVRGMPIGEPGEYTLHLYLRETGKPETQREYAVYPITITHKVPEPTDKVEAGANQ